MTTPDYMVRMQNDDQSISGNDLIEMYIDGARQLKNLVAGLPRDKATARPIPGKWSVLEVVAHLAGAEIYFSERVERTLALDNPLLVGVDETPYPQRLQYQQLDLEEEVSLIVALRAHTSRILKRIDPSDWNRTAIHTETGKVTLRQILWHAVRHIPHHLKFIEAKLQVLQGKESPHRSGDVPVVIRPATTDDIAAITAIYNEAITETTATFDTEVKSVENRMEWFLKRGPRHPVLVAEIGKEVVGWSSLNEYSDRCAYADTSETSFYVASKARGKGVGRKLKQAIMAEAKRLGFHSLLARVTEESEASKHINEELGFVKIGTMKEVGKKFGRLLDVHMYQWLVK